MTDYHSIKAWAAKSGRSVADLIALAPRNDPFYMGTPGDVRSAEWFAKLWQRFGYHGGVHVRRVHYQIVSQKKTVRMPNGEAYTNTERCWRYLNFASKSARYLELVDPEAFVDRRNPQPTIFAKTDSHPRLTIEPQEDTTVFALPQYPELPSYELHDYVGQQRYLLEIWCEKSTMNDVLLPLCEEYGVNLVTGVGELSITAVLNLVLHRITRAGKPTRILYVSDFDPAGVSMPVAVSRKIEYFVRKNDLDVDVILQPSALTEEQVRQYTLPRIPIKESERRKTHFEDHHGHGATELDALEALHPGELRSIIERDVRRYFDTNLAERSEKARDDLQRTLADIEASARETHEEELAALEREYEAICDEFAERVESWQERITHVHAQLRKALEQAKPDLKQHPVPEAAQAKEPDWVLYDSRLEYAGQLERYKAFQDGLRDEENRGAPRE